MYNPIPDAWIQVGKAIKKRLFLLIKNNLEDHENRISNIEVFQEKINVFNFEVFGYINNYSMEELSQISTYRASQNFYLQDLTIILLNASSFPQSTANGELVITIEKSINNGETWEEIIDNGNEATIGNEQFLARETAQGLINIDKSYIETDNLIRIKVLSIKDTQGSFHVKAYGEL